MTGRSTHPRHAPFDTFRGCVATPATFMAIAPALAPLNTRANRRFADRPELSGDAFSRPLLHAPMIFGFLLLGIQSDALTGAIYGVVLAAMALYHGVEMPSYRWRLRRTKRLRLGRAHGAKRANNQAISPQHR